METKIISESIKLPVSFEEAAYFKNEYRGDLIITKGILYYFPHTRINYARYSDELGGKEGMVIFELLGNFIPLLGTVPLFHLVADKSIKFGKFLKRTFRPTINSPQIRKIRLWHDDNEKLQAALDQYIGKTKSANLKFDEDSVPKPMRFAVDEITNVKFGLKFKFDAKFDNHDFRVNLIHRMKLKSALRTAGFID